ncbi:MAG TPA: LysR substrate-binding domain-containing protein [Steroidobacteraceae bacterium]|jgi:DNA-binding transcriptional LysR family regulator
MLDLDLLHSFVSVVDAGGFTRAGSRVHRTQSTVSQQIKRLEEKVGRTLLNRDGKNLTLTSEGERLLAYARRILALASEAHDALKHESHGFARLGVTEDFAAAHLPRLLRELKLAEPATVLNVHCAFSSALRYSLEHNELDLALIKRDSAVGGATCTWPEQLAWVVGRGYPADVQRDPVPLVVFGQACLYHNRSLHALESFGRTWRIAYSSPNTPGVQAAVSANLGIGLLPESAVLADHRILTRQDRFPLVTNTELALLTMPNPTARTRRLAEFVIDFCNGVAPPAAKRRLAQRARSRGLSSNRAPNAIA